MVAERRRENASAVLHQESDHGDVVAAGGAMERRPTVTVLRVHVATELHQELDYLQVT